MYLLGIRVVCRYIGQVPPVGEHVLVLYEQVGGSSSRQERDNLDSDLFLGGKQGLYYKYNTWSQILLVNYSKEVDPIA